MRVSMPSAAGNAVRAARSTSVWGRFRTSSWTERSSPGPRRGSTPTNSISLAFLTALQLLPPRQRAVLVLRDVLSWHAAEVAGLLDLSVPAVNSALQRARATVSRRYGQPGRSGPRVAPTQPQPGGLLERYVRAWESADVAGLVALLREDALLTMPPRPSVVGARAIGEFLAASMLSAARPIRLVPARANRQPGVPRLREPGPRRAVRRVRAHGARPRRPPSLTQIDAFADPRRPRAVRAALPRLLTLEPPAEILGAPARSTPRRRCRSA